MSKQVVIYCASSATIDPAFNEAARELVRALHERGYGIISGGVCHALAFLGEKGHVRYHAPKGYDAVYVEADFTAEKLDFIVDVEIGSHIGRLLGIVNGVIGSAIAGLIKEFLFSKEK